MVDKDLIQREFEHCFGGNKFVTISDDGLISTDSWAVFRSGTKLELPVKFDKMPAWPLPRYFFNILVNLQSSSSRHAASIVR